MKQSNYLDHDLICPDVFNRLAVNLLDVEVLLVVTTAFHLDKHEGPHWSKPSTSKMQNCQTPDEGSDEESDSQDEESSPVKREELRTSPNADAGTKTR